MNLELVRIILCVFFLFCTWGLMFIFLFSVKPVKKMLNLAMAYNALLIFILYTLNIYKKENAMMEFIIMVFISFLVNIIAGIGIINNLKDIKNVK